MVENFEIGLKPLDVDILVKLAEATPGSVHFSISKKAKEKVEKARRLVEETTSNGLVIYGVNTGFGSQAEKVISKDDVELLQRYLIISHSVGVGEPLNPEIVRAAIIIRINTLANGNSGISMRTLETMAEMLNKGVVPYVPSKGSVGASGDLSPLSHIALAFTKDPRAEISAKEEAIASKISKGAQLTESERLYCLKQSGEAYLFVNGRYQKMTGVEAMSKAGISRIVLGAKEGLALNNGATVSAAIASLVVHYAKILASSANLIASLSIEALNGFESAFYDQIHIKRGHAGQIEAAAAIREYLTGSELAAHIEQIQNSGNVMKEFSKVQDSYSIRCIPQVHGPVIDAIAYAEGILNKEINAVTDNPLVFPEAPFKNKFFSGGNFHGEYISSSMDFVANSLGILGNISERRVFKLITKGINEGLPELLVDPSNGGSGLMNGAMLLQYTAAALASENKTLSFPASADSIPTSENREDHVSMAPIAARKAYEVLKNTQQILAIELWCAIVALRLRIRLSRKKAGVAATAMLKKFDHIIPEFSEDRVVYDEIGIIKDMIGRGEVKL
ncbi:MAG: histidine ammonia-lyase [Candidatus Marsarchaeota archaeon]|jgi:histidine ammonia-lyase|nr:histidine ammonia-lyase [Candidatus Marsarchaeota archaeon]MCL5418599.1 histidine ammonia-lyase [Candidatus Marsarchaeota archaeon]